MSNKIESEYENVFYFCIWGKKYLDEFTKYTCNSLIENLRKINNKKNLIYIWTIEKDLKYLKRKKIIKELKNIIEIKFYNFDYIKEKYYASNSKYRFLSILQSLFISSFSFNCKYIWFLYPDFLFTKNSIKFIVNKLENNKKLFSVMLPVPQVNQESIEALYKKKGFNYISDNLADIIIKNLHKIVKIFDIRNVQLNTISVSCIHEKNYLLMNNFHLHPIVIKTDTKDYKYFDSVFPSLDEGYTNILKEKAIYIPKDSNQVTFTSLLKKDEYSFGRHNFSIDKTAWWCEAHVNEFQRKNLNHTFTFYGNKPRFNGLKFNSYLISKFKNRILRRLNYSNRDLYDKGFYNQLASRHVSQNNLENDNKLLKMNRVYLDKIYKNQFYKTFKKKVSTIIQEVHNEERSEISKIIYNLYKDSFNLKIK